MRMVATLILLVGCGRVAFEPTALADAAPDTGDALACTAPFTQHATGCYSIVPAQLTWPQAEAACEAMASKLVVIADDLENDVLAAMVADRAWIGLTDQVVELTFIWVDGTPLTYVAWTSNEPNGTADDCVELIGAIAQWNEEGCATTNPGICER